MALGREEQGTADEFPRGRPVSVRSCHLAKDWRKAKGARLANLCGRG